MIVVALKCLYHYYLWVETFSKGNVYRILAQIRESFTRSVLLNFGIGSMGSFYRTEALFI